MVNAEIMRSCMALLLCLSFSAECNKRDETQQRALTVYVIPYYKASGSAMALQVALIRDSKGKYELLSQELKQGEYPDVVARTLMNGHFLLGHTNAVANYTKDQDQLAHVYTYKRDGVGASDKHVWITVDGSDNYNKMVYEQARYIIKKYIEDVLACNNQQSSTSYLARIAHWWRSTWLARRLAVVARWLGLA